MATIIDVTQAVASIIPRVPSWDYYVNQEPDAGKLPPWVIVTITGAGVASGEALAQWAGTLQVEIRVAAHNVDAVNVLCDDHIIPAMQGAAPPQVQGAAFGSCTLASDSGTYRAGLTASDTATRYAVRVTTFTLSWSRHV